MSNSRTNDATHAEINKDYLFASGTCKNVWKGTYTAGERRGQPCVAKEFKTGSVFEEHYFAEELNIIRRVQEILDEFATDEVITNGNRILLNTPQIWTYESTGQKTLVEPFIENFEKFNSNSGWSSPNTGNSWGEVMQALSHYSYQISNREHLLCDLQGGAYQGGYILSDPAIMSRAQVYGPTDLGPDGINSFFQRHRCGCFCSREWPKPPIAGKVVFPMRQGTTMTAVPSQQNHNRMTKWRSHKEYRKGNIV